MTKYHLLFFTFTFVLATISCSSDEQLKISNLEEKFSNLSSIEDENIRKTTADSLWAQLIREDQIPFKKDTIAIFLFRGEANQVSWNGDFNSWGDDNRFNNRGIKVEGTNIWMLKTTFPSNARIDYKITVDNLWMIDPVNPHYQWSGFGPNSELRMPDWKPEPLKKRIPEAPKGTLTKELLIKSSYLDYNLQYQVYTPVGYENLNNLPVIYIFDGNDYSDENLGVSLIMLDNLIYLKRIKPIVAVFVDSRNPDDVDENRRGSEFGASTEYNDFFIKELKPTIEANYEVSKERKNNALLGTSLGGLNALYLGFKNPSVIGKLAIQAPAFWYKEKEIYGLVRETYEAEFDIFMSVGTIGDNLNDARQMKREFDRLDLNYKYLEVNEGHSWGAWSAQMDDILTQFFKKQ